jgi:hypothetical protein
MIIGSKPATNVAPAAAAARTNNNIDSDERKTVGTKRKYQEMVVVATH